MPEITTLQNLIISLEKRLLSEQARSSRTELDALLSDDFIEFGKSGKIFNKDDILNSLPKEVRLNIQAKDFKFYLLSDDILQLTYKSSSRTGHGKTVHALRSSIWKKYPSGWKMEFHQGTVTHNFD